MTAVFRSLFDMTPVWVEAQPERRDELAVHLRQGAAVKVVWFFFGVRDIDRLALAEAPVGLPIAVQLPLFVARDAGWAFQEVSP
jgi:hypothetical protein